MKEVLSLLVTRHGFSEVLDRLTELADSNAQTGDVDAQDWGGIARILEAATKQASALEGRLHPIESSSRN
jgi:hypothetical protein